MKEIPTSRQAQVARVAEWLVETRKVSKPKINPPRGAAPGWGSATTVVETLVVKQGDAHSKL